MYKNTVSIQDVLKAFQEKVKSENVQRATPSDIMDFIKKTMHHLAKESNGNHSSGSGSGSRSGSGSGSGN